MYNLAVFTPGKGTAVLIDQQTSGDLEIFRTKDGKPGVFQTLDRTKTPGGSEALRSRFVNPLSEAEGIRQVQNGIRFLRSQKVQFPSDPNQVLEVRQYLDSSWDVGSRARGIRFFVESIISSVRYRDLFNHAIRGVSLTIHFVSRLPPFLTDIQEKDPPGEVKTIVDDLLSLIDGLRLEDIQRARYPWSLFKADRILRVIRRDDLRRVLDLLSELDALIAMAEVTEERGLVLPEVVEGPEFILEGEAVVHPFLENPVGNPVKIGGGSTVVFLTGPNMAGKTTYLKAVALAAFLGHVGMGVPARRFRFSTMNGIYSSLSPEENLREGLSYFMAEVRRVREIAEAVASRQRTLVVIDEVFRGTNVKDSLDATRLVIRGFSKSRTSGFFFSSHLAELAEDLGEEPSLAFAFFEGTIQGSRASYEYVLKEGVSRQRFGLQLLEEEGVPELLRSLEA